MTELIITAREAITLMFKNFKIDNAKRVNFSGTALQTPKSKWGYLRNLYINGVSTQVQTTQGKNLIDHTKLEIGDIATDTGLSFVRSYRFRTGNHIAVLQNTIYYLSINNPYLWTGNIASARFYGVSKNYLSYQTLVIGTGTRRSISFTTPANCCFVRLVFVGDEATNIIQADLNNNIYQPQLELTAVTAYAAFVPNSPSPEYPGTIQSLPGSFNFTSCGKNLTNIANGTNIGFTNYYYVNVAANLKLFPNTTYKLSFNLSIDSVTYPILSTSDLNYTVDNHYYITAGYGNTPGMTAVLENTEFSFPLSNRQSMSFTTPAIFVGGYNYLFIRFISKASTLHSATLVGFVSNVQLEYGSTATAYAPYVGNNYPYRIEDTDGVLHATNDLPELDTSGKSKVADKYNRDNSELTQRVKVLTVSSGTGWYCGSSVSDITYIYFVDINSVFGVSPSVQSLNIRSNIAIPSNGYTPNTCYYIKHLTAYTQIILRVSTAELGIVGGETQAQLNALAVAWINSKISTVGNIIFIYELATPQTFAIKSYSPAFLYNAKPVQVEEDTANVFTDAVTRPDISAKVISI